jgi:protein-S-isoprenylcysteine O-methyltransferase Ste14
MNIAPELPLSALPPRRLPTVRSAFAFRHRGAIGVALFAPAGIAALFSAPSVAEVSLFGLSLNAAGWLALFSYVALRVWATLYVGGRKDRELQTDGPYSVCRNPLYLGSFAFAIGVACFLKSIVLAAMLLPGIMFYLRFVVRAEEHFLEIRFQDAYRAYCSRTPRFWPRWSAFRSPPRVTTELKRLKGELLRLSRAAAFVILLQVLVQLRAGSTWPHWFSMP